MIKVIFNFTSQQKIIWEKLPELCEPACATSELAKKIRNSMLNTNKSNATLEVTDEEYASLIHGGMPIRIGDDENALAYPILKDGYWLVIE